MQRFHSDYEAGNDHVPLGIMDTVPEDAGQQWHEPTFSGVEKPESLSLAIAKRTDYTAETPKF